MSGSLNRHGGGRSGARRGGWAFLPCTSGEEASCEQGEGASQGPYSCHDSECKRLRLRQCCSYVKAGLVLSVLKTTRTSSRLRQRIASRRLLPSARLRSGYARAGGGVRGG